MHGFGATSPMATTCPSCSRTLTAADMSDTTHAVRLTNAERERRWANVRPKDAATLILIDRTAKKPEDPDGPPARRAQFMPGKFVFPGGRSSPATGAWSPPARCTPRSEERLMARVQRPTCQRARALALAAIRETFEETGLLLGTTDYGAPDIALPEGPGRTSPALACIPDAREPAFRGPRHHAAAPAQALRHALLRRRGRRHRRTGRGRRAAPTASWSSSAGSSWTRRAPGPAHHHVA